MYTLISNRYNALTRFSGCITDDAVSVESSRGLRLQHPLDAAHDVTQEEIVLARLLIIFDIRQACQTYAPYLDTMTESSEPAATSNAMTLNACTPFLVPSYNTLAKYIKTRVKCSPIG
jgi:hypothetical protein